MVLKIRVSNQTKYGLLAPGPCSIYIYILYSLLVCTQYTQVSFTVSIHSQSSFGEVPPQFGPGAMADADHGAYLRAPHPMAAMADCQQLVASGYVNSLLWKNVLL